MDLLLVALLWLVSLLVITWKYLRLTDLEKGQLRVKLKHPIAWLDTFRILGVLFIVTGVIYKEYFSGLGVVILSIAWFATGYINYDTNKKSSGFLMLGSVLFVLVYFGRYLWVIMF